MVFDEANLVVDRVNNKIATEMQLFQMALSSILDRRAGTRFKAEIKKLAKPAGE
jgi:hypothetical protein